VISCLRPGVAGRRSGVTAAVPGNGTRSQGLGWWARKRCPRQQPFQPAPPGRGSEQILSLPHPHLLPPRPRARSLHPEREPDPPPPVLKLESLIGGGVASIMPMKRKDIPALLVSAPPLAPGTTPQPQFDRPTAPSAAARPSPRWRSFPPGTRGTELGPPRRPPPSEAFRAGWSMRPPCWRPFQATRASPGAVTEPVLFGAWARWAARRAAVRTGEGRNPRFLLCTI
jgi:hypothetical protein